MTSLVAKKPCILLFSRSSQSPALIEPMHLGLSAASDIEFHLISRAEELGALVAVSARAVLFANCLMKEDIADLYNQLPQFAARVNDGTLKILVLNSIGHPRLGSLLRSRASVEILEMPLTLKAVQHKLKIALSAVHQAYQKAAGARAHSSLEPEVDSTLGTKTRAARAKPKAAGQEVLWQSAVEFNFDVWWIPSQKNIRNVVGVWLIDLMGPGPVVGVWEELSGIERVSEKAWAWRPRSTAEDLFLTPGGRWIFFGKQPEFSWQKTLWSFVSKQPLFAYFPDGENAPEFVRIEYRPGEGLLLLENSTLTQGLLTRIEATFESRLGARAGGEAPAEEDGGGSFEGWDFPLEASGESASSFEPAPKIEGEIDWKDHTGAQGVNFRAKNLHVGVKPAGKGIRNALTPDQAIGGKLGIAPVKLPGLSAGTEAFEKIELIVEMVRKNGKIVAKSPDILLYEMTEAGAVFLIRDRETRLADQYLIRLRLDAGISRMECMMNWELTSIDLALEDGTLATGMFRGGDFAPLIAILDRIDSRKRELKDFYRTARG